MAERRSVLLLLLIMASVTLLVTALVIALLYNTALNEEQNRLIETAQSQARLIESVTRHDKIYNTDFPDGPENATLSKIIDAHKHYQGFGETGEFTLARRIEDNIVFILQHRHGNLEFSAPVPFQSKLAEPMRRALSGLSGTVVGLDYRGETVVAAYEPVAELNLGIVAKIDLSEIRKPFIDAGIISFSIALVLVLFGSILFRRITNPLINRIVQSEEKFRTITENSADAIFIADQQGKYQYVNQRACEMLGFSREQLLEMSIADVSHEDNLDENMGNFGQLLETGNLFTEIKLQKKDGTFIATDLNAVILPNGLVYGSCRDITERKRMEDALRESEAKFKGLFENSPDIVSLTDLDGMLLDINTVAPGYKKSDVIGSNFTDYLTPEQAKLFYDTLKQAVQTGTSQGYEVDIPNPGGTIFSWYNRISPVKTAERTDKVVINCTDITERKKAERKIKESLKEKEVLLKEIHHRVKNNLQLISSMLNLQLLKIKDQSAIKLIKNSQNRIQSMALVHEKLYQTKDLTKIPMKDYVFSITDFLFQTYRSSGKSLPLEVDILDEQLDINTAIPCGLIINELISNSLKHAFIDDEDNKIIVQLKSINRSICLTISDTGRGFPKDVDFKNTTSLGLQLVSTLVKQLNGTIELDNKKGAKFQIIIPKT
jgi:two-component system, sensor histidine kinase PdtaS